MSYYSDLDNDLGSEKEVQLMDLEANLDKGLWKDGDGNRIYIKNMSKIRLERTIRFLENKINRLIDKEEDEDEDYINIMEGYLDSMKLMFKTKFKNTGLSESYNIASKAKVGTKIICPVCGKEFIKNTYHQKFCSNYKTNGKNNCKDKYHNFFNPRY